MPETKYSIVNDDFFINGLKTYSEISGSDENIHGLLFNARFIQGVFNDVNPANKLMYDRFGKKFDPDTNTNDLIEHLREWYNCGIRAITVGIQGGGPIYTYKDWSTIDTDAFSKDGKEINLDVFNRLMRIIHACDKIGMIVIVSILYQAQAHLFEDGLAIVNAVRTTCRKLAEQPYDNIIIEVANEHDVGEFRQHPIIGSGEGIGTLINLAREWTNGRFAVGSSGGGGSICKEAAKASDVILVHGNDLRREELGRFILKVRSICPNKPIVVNEDSPMFDGALRVAYATHSSWGYYNNATKQEPPTDWSITRGEDEFFAKRLNNMIHGIKDVENEYYLQGFEKDANISGRYYVRLASLYPRRIDRVEFYEDDKLLYTAFDEPFLMYSLTTWEQKPYIPSANAKEFKAVVIDSSEKTKEIIHRF